MTTTYIQITRDNHTWFGELITTHRFTSTYRSLQSVPDCHINKSEYYATCTTDTITHYTTTEFQQLFPELFI